MDLDLLLRFIHLTCGIFWAGSGIVMATFVLPAVSASGPEGGKVMQQIAKTNNYPMVLNIASILTILTGIFLLWRLSGGFQSAWFGTTYGIILSTGAVIGFAAYVVGFTVNRPSVARMTAIGKEIAQAGGPPSQQQMQELGKLRQRLSSATKLIAVLLGSSIVLMEMARYI